MRVRMSHNDNNYNQDTIKLLARGYEEFRGKINQIRRTGSSIVTFGS